MRLSLLRVLLLLLRRLLTRCNDDMSMVVDDSTNWGEFMKLGLGFVIQKIKWKSSKVGWIRLNKLAFQFADSKLAIERE